MVIFMELVSRFQALWESVLSVTTGLLSDYCVPAAALGTGMQNTQHTTMPLVASRSAHQ